MVPSSPVEDQFGKQRRTVLTVKNTFHFPVEIYAHEEDELIEVERYEITAGGPSIQMECQIVG